MSTTEQAPLACSIIAPRSHEQEEVSLVSAMHSLVLDARHPLALEIAGTPAARLFVLRATTPEALDHAIAQVRARYPQASITPLGRTDDPFRLEASEAVSAVELRGAAPDLPLRTLEERDLLRQANDPVLGLLAALENLPPHTRAVAQLALVPAKANWSRTYARRGIEHALEPERQQKLANLRSDSGPSTAVVILAVVGFLALLLFRALQVSIPAWVLSDLLDIIHGNFEAVSSDQLTKLLIGGGILLVGGFGLFIVIDQLRYRFRKPLYDQHLVAQKIQGAAYHARLRVYVIGPGRHPSQPHFGLGWLRQLLAIVRQLTSAIQHTQQAFRQQHLAGETGAPGQSLIRPLLRLAFALGWNYLVFLMRALWQWSSAFCKTAVWRRQQAHRRRTMLTQFTAAYRQYHLAQGDYFQPASLSARKARHCLGGRWGRDVARSVHLLSTEALANLWHLPAMAVLSNLALVDSRSVQTRLIPTTLARQAGPVIGISNHAGHAVPVPLIPDQLRLHGFVCGKSGEGKSTFLEHLAQTAMEQGEGLLLADPHGDLADEVLRLVPAHRIDDVVLIDLADTTHAFGLNPIDVLLGREREKAISDILNTFSYLFATGWGHRMANAFRAGLRTLYEANRALVAHDPQDGPAQQYTLLDILPLFTSESFCHALLQDVHDDWLHRWWRKYFEPLNLYMQRDIINPVLNKTTEFEGPIPSHIIGQGRSTLDFKQLIQDRRILIVKLAQGTVGHDIAALIGTTLLGLLQATLEEQGQLAKADRTRLLIIIDEFQTLTGLDFQALAQLRKYGATFVLATQSLDYLDELDRKILPIVFANVKHLTSFQVSAEDARKLSRELGIEEEPLTTLATHMCYGRWTSHEERQPPFSFTLGVPTLGPIQQAEMIRLRSEQRYTLPIPLVEQRLKAAMRRAEALPARPQTAQAATASAAEDEPAAPAGKNGTQATPGKRKDRGRKAEQARKKPGNPLPQSPYRQGSITPMELVGSLPGAEGDQETLES